MFVCGAGDIERERERESITMIFQHRPSFTHMSYNVIVQWLASTLWTTLDFAQDNLFARLVTSNLRAF